MPDANPLVVQSKKDGDGPGPFTEGNGDYGYATGINIAESATDAFKGIADGDWVSGGLGVASLAGEIAGAAIDPFGYLMSSVASFLMEHVQPLKDMLDSVAGNPPVIQSYADTWGNVAKSLQERQKDLENAVKTGTAEWKGDGADAYRKSAAEAADAIGGAATVASAIGTVTMIMGQVVAFVRGLVRQLIADLVGKLISWVMEEVFSLGFGTPLVVAQAVTAISKWGEKISELLTKLCETMRRVSPLLGKLAEVFTKIIKVLGKLAGKVTGLDVISTKNIKAGGFFHRGGSGGGGAGGSGGGHHGGSGEGDADPGSPSGSRRSNGSDSADGGDGPNGSHTSSDGSDAPGDHSGDSGSHNGSDSPSSDSPSSPGGSHSSSPDGTGPSTIDTATSSSRRGSDSPGGSHTDSSPSTFAGDSSPTSRGGGDSPADSSYSPQSSSHSDGPSSVSTPHSSGAPHSGGSASSGGGTHSGGSEPSPHRSSSSDSTSASGYAPPRADAPAPQSAPPQHIRSNDGGGSSPNQNPAGGGIPQQGGGGSPTSAPAGGGGPAPRPSGSGWTGTPGTRAPEAAPNRVPDSGPSGRRPSGGPSPSDGGGPSRTPDRSGPGPQRPSDGGSSARPSEGGSSPQRTGDSSPQRPSEGGGGGSSPQRPSDSSSSGPQRPGDGGEAGQPKRPGAEPGLGRSEPAPTSGGGSPSSANRGSGDGSAPPAVAAVATGPGGGQRGPEAGGGARRPDGSPEPVARGGARTDAPAKPGEANSPQRTGKESPAQNGKPNADESGKPKNGDKPGKPENTEPNKKPGQHEDAETKPGNDKPEPKPDHADPKQHGPKHSDSDGPSHPDHDGTPPHHDEPLSPDEVNHRHAEDTPAGSSYHRDDPELGDLPHRVQPDPDGRYTVDVHVTADGHARIGDRLYTPEEFADILRRNGNYDGGPIRLIGCDAGSNDFAHRLSRDLDTEVMAPSKPAWTDSNGHVFSSDYEIGPDGRMRPRIPPDGEWSVHRPDGTAHRVGDDGFAPDGKHHDPHGVDADSSRHRGEDGDDDGLDWRDRPGPDGRTPRENLADPEYLKKHYYEWTDQTTGRKELRIKHSAVDPENPPHPVDLVDGKPVFKHDRPAAEFMGYDDARSRTHAPQRDSADGATPQHDAGNGQHQGDHAGQHDSHGSGDGQHPGEQHVPGTHSDTSNWREKDYDAIDQKVHDRETKYHELNDTPKDSPEWKDAHNAKNDASEKLGEEASGHAVRDRLHREFTQAHPDQNFDVREHPDAPEGSHRYQVVDGDGNVRADITPRHPIDGEKPGAGNFDHIWEVDYHNGGEPHYIVHEAKGPGGQPSTRYVPEDKRTYRQGHPAYFDDIVTKMARTDPDLADALERAKLQKRLDYVEVRALVDQTERTHKSLGYAYKPFNGYDYQSPLTPASGEE